MANIKSAKKRISVIEKKTARNKRTKGHIKAILKSFDLAMADNDMEEAEKQLKLAEKKMMQAVAKGTFHKKTVSRKISRLTKQFNKAKAQEA